MRQANFATATAQANRTPNAGQLKVLPTAAVTPSVPSQTATPGPNKTFSPLQYRNGFNAKSGTLLDWPIQQVGNQFILRKPHVDSNFTQGEVEFFDASGTTWNPVYWDSTKDQGAINLTLPAEPGMMSVFWFSDGTGTWTQLVPLPAPTPIMATSAPTISHGTITFSDVPHGNIPALNLKLAASANRGFTISAPSLANGGSWVWNANIVAFDASGNIVGQTNWARADAASWHYMFPSTAKWVMADLQNSQGNYSLTNIVTLQ
jgi:hypothetical protein